MTEFTQYHQALNETHTRWLYKSVSSLIKREPLCITPGESVQSAAELMSAHGVSSIMVMDNTQLIGIVTDRDLRNRVVSKGFNTQLPIKQIMTEAPAFLTQHKTIFDAICVMNTRGIHHLPIVNEDSGSVLGMVTNTDISKQQRSNLLFMMSDLSNANNLQELAGFAWRIPEYVSDTANQASDAQIASKIVAQSIDIVTRKLINWYEKENGEAPLAYCWLALGAQAREDQLLPTKQSNAILLARSPSHSEAEYFTALANYVCMGLGECGIKLASNNLMACNPELQLSVDDAMDELKACLSHQNTVDMTALISTLDLRTVAGNDNVLQKFLLARAKLFENKTFITHLFSLNMEAKMMQHDMASVEHMTNNSDIFSMCNMCLARINKLISFYALAKNIPELSTLKRLHSLSHSGLLISEHFDDLTNAWLFLNTLIWRKQLIKYSKAVSERHYLPSDNELNLINKAISMIHDAEEFAANQLAHS